jgi:hypothetical protein
MLNYSIVHAVITKKTYDVYQSLISVKGELVMNPIVAFLVSI